MDPAHVQSPVATSTPWYSFMTTLQSVAQFGHFFGALSVLLIASVFFAHLGLYWSFGVGLAYALGKEFWFDIRYEKDSWPDSIMDFSFYVLGGLTAVCIFFLAVHTQRLAF